MSSEVSLATGEQVVAEADTTRTVASTKLKDADAAPAFLPLPHVKIRSQFFLVYEFQPTMGQVVLPGQSQVEVRGTYARTHPAINPRSWR